MLSRSSEAELTLSSAFESEWTRRLVFRETPWRKNVQIRYTLPVTLTELRWSLADKANYTTFEISLEPMHDPYKAKLS